MENPTCLYCNELCIIKSWRSGLKSAQSPHVDWMNCRFGQPSDFLGMHVWTLRMMWRRTSNRMEHLPSKASSTMKKESQKPLWLSLFCFVFPLHPNDTLHPWDTREFHHVLLRSFRELFTVHLPSQMSSSSCHACNTWKTKMNLLTPHKRPHMTPLCSSANSLRVTCLLISASPLCVCEDAWIVCDMLINVELMNIILISMNTLIRNVSLAFKVG